MSAPKYAASQFTYGTTVTVPAIGDKPDKPFRQPGKVVGWDSSNTHVIVELDDSAEQHSFHVSNIIPVDQQS